MRKTIKRRSSQATLSFVFASNSAKGGNGLGLSPLLTLETAVITVTVLCYGKVVPGIFQAMQLAPALECLELLRMTNLHSVLDGMANILAIENVSSEM